MLSFKLIRSVFGKSTVITSSITSNSIKAVIVLWALNIKLSIVMAMDPYRTAGRLFRSVITDEIYTPSFFENGYVFEMLKEEVELDYGVYDYQLQCWGAGDPGYTPRISSVRINGVDVMPDKRGFSVIQLQNGKLLNATVYATTQSLSNAESMANEIDAIQDGTLILICLDGTATATDMLKSALRAIGGRHLEISYRNGYCLTNRKASTTGKWLNEERTEKRKGPSICRLMAPWNRHGYFQDP